MKNNLTRKALSFIIVFGLFFSSVMVAIPELVKATNTNAWAEITTRKTNTTPALGDNQHQYMGQPYQGKFTSFVDVMETKPDGSKLFHYFVAIPMAYAWSGTNEPGSIYHSSNQGLSWNRINPNWGPEGGGVRTSLMAVNQMWTDGAGSQWSKKIFLYTNNSSNFGPGWGYYYQWYRPSLFRYDGNGTDTNWREIWSDTSGNYAVGTPYTAGNVSYGFGNRTYMEEMNGQLYFVSFWRPGGSAYWDLNFQVRIMRSNTTSLAQLCSVNSINPLYDTLPTNFVGQYYSTPYFLAFKKAGDYLYLSTCAPNQGSFTAETANGNLFRSGMGGIGGWAIAPTPAAPLATITNVYSFPNNGTGTFNMIIGGVTYQARATYGQTTFWVSFWSNTGYDYSYYMFYYGWFGSYVAGRTCKYTYSAIDTVNKIIWVTGIAVDYYNIYAWAGYPPPPLNLDGAPNPLVLEVFKGYLYAGYGKGAEKLRRTNNFSDYLNYATWPGCGAIQAPDNNNVIRTQSYGVLALGKSSFRNNMGQMEDINLYIGGIQGPGPGNTGYGALFFTQGLDSLGNDAVPLRYQILEDEWKYTKTSPTVTGSAYRNQIYDFYNVYPGLLGLVVSFNASTTRPFADGFGNTYNQRKFHIYNAPPTCDIRVNPEPVINERGTDSDVNFQFIPVGGYGPGNVKITLELPNNVFLPTKDSDNVPINTQFNKPIPMNGGTINISAKIRSTNAATVKKYLAKITIEDLVLGIKIIRYFEFIIIYPKPGYSINVSPSYFDLYQGTCPPNQCCSESCKIINVDLVSRNDFEDNVIIGINWIAKPPSDDVTIKWNQSSFIYDYIDDKTIEAITRKNIGTRYNLELRVTPNTTVGTWKFKMFFISGLIKRTQTVTFTVGPAKPAIKITSNPSVIRVVPGAIATYRLLIESLNGFVGKVNLTLQNLPTNITVLSFRAELPPPGYADNYVEISPGNPAYANLVIQTYSITTPPTNPRKVTVAQVNEKLNSVTWDFSFKGSYPIAGYEIWRATSQYIDTAVKLGTVNSGTNAFDDNAILRDKSYFYFVRAFDTQIPPNYSTYTSSGEFKTTSVNIFGTISNEGTLPGFANIEILGQGVGYGPDSQAVAPVGLGISVLHIYEQVQNMATPAFTWWTSLLLLISMLVIYLLLNLKKEKKTSH